MLGRQDRQGPTYRRCRSGLRFPSARRTLEHVTDHPCPPIANGGGLLPVRNAKSVFSKGGVCLYCHFGGDLALAAALAPQAPIHIRLHGAGDHFTGLFRKSYLAVGEVLKGRKDSAVDCSLKSSLPQPTSLARLAREMLYNTLVASISISVPASMWIQASMDVPRVGWPHVCP